MKNNSAFIKVSKIFAVLAVPLIIVSAVVFRNSLLALKDYLPACLIYETTGWLCPACGNTRSVIALLNGNIIDSIGYNIMPVLLCVIGIVLYIELVTWCLGKHVAVFPRNNKFVVGLALIVCLYYVARNIFPVLTLC